MVESRTPTWPEQPLDESPRDYSGAMPWLEALSNWVGLALPGRGGIGNPIDPLQKLVEVLMRQERPVGRQIIPGNLSWVAKQPVRKGRKPIRMVNEEPNFVNDLETLGMGSGGTTYPEALSKTLSDIISPPGRFTRSLYPERRGLPVGGIYGNKLYQWLLEKTREVPNMGYRLDRKGRFRF